MADFESAETHDDPGTPAHFTGDPGNHLELLDAVSHDQHVRFDGPGNENIFLAVAVEVELLRAGTRLQCALGLVAGGHVEPRPLPDHDPEHCRMGAGLGGKPDVSLRVEVLEDLPESPHILFNDRSEIDVQGKLKPVEPPRKGITGNGGLVPGGFHEVLVHRRRHNLFPGGCSR